MLNKEITDKGFSFSVIYNDAKLPFCKWSSTDDCIYYLPLSMLVDNSYATVTDDVCEVPFENIYALDDDEQVLLGIPPKYEKFIRLRGEGMLNISDFKYKVEFLTFVPDGELLFFNRVGNILNHEECQYLLSDVQYELLLKVDEFNNLDEDKKTADNNFRCFAEIKKLAIDAGCELDSYLSNENVFVPENIKINVEEDTEGFAIVPSVDFEENDKFKRTFDRMRKVQSVYPLQNENGERVRVVLNPSQKENLETLKKIGGHNKTREQIKELTERPTEFFDPDVVDLSELYSDRVIEIGVYKPKFSSFISPYKSCWIAGATIENIKDGTSNIVINSAEDLEELRRCIASAENENKILVDYKGVQADIDDMRFLAIIAEKQLKDPNHPVEADKDGRKVLIIEGNEDKVGFSVKQENIENCENYTLYTNSFLNPNFVLKTHQKEGIAWLQYLYKNKASGCLMADDMGLGKTLQILYFIDWHSRTFPNHKPYLIVAPVSLLENWENEYKRFFGLPQLNVNVLTSKDVSRLYNKDIVRWMQQMDIILTNYESLRIAQLNFCAVEFDIVALDEAQKIKTPGTLITNAAKAIKANFRIAMTGTPVENSLLDLWCIMDFCVPGLLGNARNFTKKYQNTLKNEDTDIVALGNQIHEQLGIYFIRRLKKDAASDLPEKKEYKRQVQMPAIQEKIYNGIVSNAIGLEHCNMLATIMYIREVSEHPYLYDKTLNEHSLNDVIEASARLQATIPLLDEIRQRQEKVILFAERKEVQKMLQRMCFEKYGIVAKIINGDTPSIVTSSRSGKQSRQACIDDFQNVDGFNVIIMSPIAAGMGLNVVAANNVIHYSRHWNPAKENQATDRVYRIGQEKDVYVYYPMAVSLNFKSFDETLDELLSRKTYLATSTLFPTERIEVNAEELGHLLFGNDALAENRGV